MGSAARSPSCKLPARIPMSRVARSPGPPARHRKALEGVWPSRQKVGSANLLRSGMKCKADTPVTHAVDPGGFRSSPPHLPHHSTTKKGNEPTGAFPSCRNGEYRREGQPSFFAFSTAFTGVASFSDATVNVPLLNTPEASKYSPFSRLDFSIRLFAVALPFSSNL